MPAVEGAPRFVAVQDNGYSVTFQLKQNGSKLWGVAGYRTTAQTIIANVGGGISGDHMRLRALWTLSGVGAIGVYMAQIGPNGVIVRALTYDEYTRPARTVAWHTHERMVCN